MLRFPHVYQYRLALVRLRLNLKHVIKWWISVNVPFDTLYNQYKSHSNTKENTLCSSKVSITIPHVEKPFLLLSMRVMPLLIKSAIIYFLMLNEEMIITKFSFRNKARDFETWVQVNDIESSMRLVSYVSDFGGMKWKTNQDYTSRTGVLQAIYLDILTIIQWMSCDGFARQKWMKRRIETPTFL